LYAGRLFFLAYATNDRRFLSGVSRSLTTTWQSNTRTQGGGVFCNPSSAAAPAKLRLLYECAPLAYVIEAAGGASHCGRGSVLDLEIPDTGARTTVALGAAEEVAECLEAMAASHEDAAAAAGAAAAN
jgi:fructose-1,6-bisphosphatase